MRLVATFFVTGLTVFILFLASLTTVSSTPSSALQSNLLESVKTLRNEGTYPSFGFKGRQIVLDNFTEPILLNTAYSIDSQKPLSSSLLGIRYEYAGDRLNQISNLEKALLGEATLRTGYERYWHGYLVYVRPLIAFFPYSAVRVILSIFLYGGFFSLMALVWRKVGKKVFLALLLGCIAVDFFYLGMSLQFSSVFLVGIYSSIYFLTRKTISQTPYVLFFTVGALTAFFDLLTAPLVTLGILLVVTQTRMHYRLSRVIFLSLAWAAGYILLWASKWIAAEILVAPGAILTSWNQIVTRTVSEADPYFSHLQTLRLNIMQLIGYSTLSKIGALIAGVLMIIFTLLFLKRRKINSSKMFIWLTIALIPYAWYLVAANHSYLHVWYTYRAQFMTVSAGILAVCELIDWQKVKRAWKRFSRLSISAAPHHTN